MKRFFINDFNTCCYSRDQKILYINSELIPSNDYMEISKMINCFLDSSRPCSPTNILSGKVFEYSSTLVNDHMLTINKGNKLLLSVDIRSNSQVQRLNRLIKVLDSMNDNQYDTSLSCAFAKVMYQQQ